MRKDEQRPQEVPVSPLELREEDLTEEDLLDDRERPETLREARSRVHGRHRDRRA